MAGTACGKFQVDMLAGEPNEPKYDQDQGYDNCYYGFQHLFLFLSLDDAAPFNAVVASEHPGDGFGVNFMFLDQDAGGKVSTVSLSSNGHRGLQDNRTAVEMLIDQMDRAAGDLHAVSEGLVLGIEAREGGQQRRVDIEDAIGKLRNEPTAREQAHIACQTNPINPMLASINQQLARQKQTRSTPADSIAPQGRPSSRARTRPAAAALFEKTNPISQSSWPVITLRAIASKFEPRPESRMPRRAGASAHR